jgi:hypothetical protein
MFDKLAAEPGHLGVIPSKTAHVHLQQLDYFLFLARV